VVIWLYLLQRHAAGWRIGVAPAEVWLDWPVTVASVYDACARNEANEPSVILYRVVAQYAFVDRCFLPDSALTVIYLGIFCFNDSAFGAGSIEAVGEEASTMADSNSDVLG
jgi:hypothetical protein